VFYRLSLPQRKEMPLESAVLPMEKAELAVVPMVRAEEPTEAVSLLLALNIKETPPTEK
jgi:hypothetical protein